MDRRSDKKQTFSPGRPAFNVIAAVEPECAIVTSQGMDFINKILFHPLRNQRHRIVGYAIDSELKSRAQKHKTSFEREKIRSARGALALALSELQGKSLTAMQWERELRRIVNDRYTEDVLGTDWRRRSKIEKNLSLMSRKELSHQENEQEAARGELEARLHLDLIERNLSPRENDLLRMLRKGCSLSEAAKNLGIQDSTARNLFARIKKKINPM